MNVRTLRKGLGLTQAEFWEPLGVTQSGGSRHESGRPIAKPVRMLLEIAYGTQGQAARVWQRLRGAR